MSLEDQLIALADKHDLRSITLTMCSLDDGRRFFGCYVRSDVGCETGNAKTFAPIGDHIASAIAVTEAKRVSTNIALPAAQLEQRAERFSV